MGDIFDRAAAVPKTLPANFTGWDKPGYPPATLPANFNQWDDQPASATSGLRLPPSAVLETSSDVGSGMKLPPGAVLESPGDIFDQAAKVSDWDAAQEAGHQNRMSLLSGFTGMPTPSMNAEDRASFDKGKAAGAMSVPAVAGATAFGFSGLAASAARILAPIAKKYGIKALEGAGLGAGYDLYRELKRIFEGE